MTWTTAAIVGGVLAYPVTVGLARRALVSSTLVVHGKVTNERKQTIQQVSWIWPLFLVAVVLYTLSEGVARAVGPKTYTGDDR